MAQVRHIIAIQPRLMPAPTAAAYIGVSETKLRTLGLPRKILGGKKVYERADLDAYADGLLYEDEAEKCDKTDAIFGIGGSS